jgi:exonuclease SbcC
MIPLKLELTNFLAYRHPAPLDLAGLHLACLAGANGAGKSSLLDAITWALWGKARTRRDDDLIHGDEVEMQVRLTFTMDGNCYRVQRYRTRKGRGSSALSLEIQDGEMWRPISEPTIRETQERINRLLRLDYQTFINSAFLMQGRADEFTQKTPGERKAILSEILGLDAWEVYEGRAKEHLKALDMRAGQIEAEMRHIDEELAREADYKQDLIDAQDRLNALHEEVGEAESYVRELDNARQQRDSLGERADDLVGRIERDADELNRLRDDLAAAQGRLAGYRETLAQQDEIEAGYNRLQEARDQERDFSARLREQSELREQHNTLQQTIAGEGARLRAERSGFVRRLADLVQALDEGEGDAEMLAEAEAHLEELEALQGERDAWAGQLADVRERRADLEATNRGQKSKMDSLSGQRNQIEAATEPVCPLCEQELSDEHRADLLARLEKDGVALAESWRANRDEIELLGGQIAELERSIHRADDALRNLPPRRDQVARLRQQIEQAENQRAEKEAVEAELAAVEVALAAEDFAGETRIALAEVQADLAALGYDRAAHQEASDAADAYRPFEERKAELDHVLRALPETESHIAGLDERIAEHEGQIEADQARLDDLAAELEGVEAQLAALEGWEDRLETLRDAQAQAQTQVGAARQRLNALDRQRERRATLVEEQDRLAEDTSVYGQLREAFGKNGIPAMIIEATIPEIETEANEILARMTDGRMHVRFDTQREKVTGGVKETLDILIADEIGTRDYETFSGGEAFRVDFAIRLALSRLLARRAGAQLRTLIVDEGFGTQDAQGRERLVQAINAIRDDFDLILVITHIEELKDAFPVRIEVTKLPGGSVIEII